jgi:hypothetical protein
VYYKPTVIQNYTLVTHLSLTNPKMQCLIQLCKVNREEELFEITLIEAVDEGFSIFGHSSKETIYRHLQKAYRIQKNDIPRRIDRLSEALYRSFGLGAKIIEMRIIKALHEKNPSFTYFPKKREIILKEYTESLQRFLTRSIQPFQTCSVE